MKLSKIFSFFLFPICVFIVHIVFSFYRLYSYFSWLDIPMHFFGGFSISYTVILFLGYFNKRDFLRIKNSFLLILIVVSIVCFVAVLWEFYEFFLKTFFDVVTQPSLEDTLLDLILGIFGGLVGGLLFKKVFNN